MPPNTQQIDPSLLAPDPNAPQGGPMSVDPASTAQSLTPIGDLFNIPASAMDELQTLMGKDGPSMIQNKSTGTYSMDPENSPDGSEEVLADAVKQYNDKRNPLKNSDAAAKYLAMVSPVPQQNNPAPQTANNDLLSALRQQAGVNPTVNGPVTRNAATDADLDKGTSVTTQGVDQTPPTTQEDDNTNSLLQQILAKPDINIPSTGYNAGTLQNMLAARQASNNGELVNNIIKGANIASAGFAGHGAQVNPAAEEALNNNIQQSKDIYSQEKDLIANEKNDPNSNTSQLLRGYLGGIGIHVGDNTSAASIEQVLPVISKQILSDKNVALRLLSEQARQKQSEKLLNLRQQGQQQLLNQKGQIQANNIQIKGQQQAPAQEQADYYKLQQDTNYKKANQQVSDAKTLSTMTDAAVNDPIVAKALALYAARYSTGGQRLNQTEIKAMGGGSQAILDRLKQIATTEAYGTLTPDNAKFIHQFIDITSQGAQNQKTQMEQDRAEAWKKVHGNYPRWYTPQSAAGMHKPGDIVSVGGKQFQVAADGDTLNPV
jgi:hypothetical protein